MSGEMQDSHRFSLCVQGGDLRTDTCDLSVLPTARDLTAVNILDKAEGVSDLGCEKLRSCAWSLKLCVAIHLPSGGQWVLFRIVSACGETHRALQCSLVEQEYTPEGWVPACQCVAVCRAVPRTGADNQRRE